VLHKTLTRPILTYESECPLTGDESLKEQYEESFTVILTILEYGEQDTIGSFISSVMN
jgi:hypothetical protein